MNDETTAWYCHGCKRSGNAISFLAEHEGVSRMEARRWLADEYDSEFREPEGGAKGMWRKHFAEVSEEPDVVNPPLAEDLIARFLPMDPGARYYMIQRGFSPETLDQWYIGWDEISERVTIPVFDNDDQLVGFKGRSVDPEVKPKYKILGDRPEGQRRRYGFFPYKKAQIVFGLDRTGQRNKLIVCEGELNAIALHQMGFDNAVGVGGSDFSEYQANLLRWHADELILFFDQDDAGEQAVWGWYDEHDKFHPGIYDMLSGVMTLHVVPEHDWGDPADMLNSGPHLAAELIEEAVPAISYRYRKLVS
jgi:DNA primase